MVENINEINFDDNKPYFAPHYPFSLEGHWQPWYDDRRDYNTNAPTYYDYLSNFNKLIKDITELLNRVARRNIEVEDTNCVDLTKVNDWIDEGNACHSWHDVITLKADVILSTYQKAVNFDSKDYKLSNTITCLTTGLYAPDYLPLLQALADKLNDEINSNNSKFEHLENEEIPSIKNEINSIKTQISDLVNLGIDDKRILLAVDNDERGYSCSNVPDYYTDRLNAINNQLLTSNDVFNFIHQTDTHNQWTSYAPNSIKHVGYATSLSRKGRIDALLFNGDNCNGWYDKTQIKDEERQFATTAIMESHPSSTVFINIGNHDRGDGQNGKNSPTNALSFAELRNIYGHNLNMFNETRPDNVSYCYKDFPDKRIRFIMLDSYDVSDQVNSDGTYKYNSLNTSGFSGAQVKWLATEALNVPANYLVVVATHAPVTTTLDTFEQINGSQVLEVLTAFNQHRAIEITCSNSDSWFETSFSTSFENNTAQIVGVFSGHTHADADKAVGGVRFISTRGSLCYSGDEGREVNTYTEDAWDCVSVNRSTRQITMKRFGAGSDRTFGF